jgi:hypothetical protein
MILGIGFMAELEVVNLFNYDDFLGPFQHLFNLIKRD